MIISEEANNILLTLKESIKPVDSFAAALNICLKEICSFTGWDYGEAWLPDSDGKQQKFVTSWNSNKNLFKDFEKFSSLCKFAKGIGLVGKTWEAGKEIMDSKLSISSDFLRYEAARKAGIAAGVSFYIKLNDSFPLVIAFFLVKPSPNVDKNCKIISEICGEIGKLLQEKLST